jgi:hypothetical protein
VANSSWLAQLHLAEDARVVLSVEVVVLETGVAAAHGGANAPSIFVVLGSLERLVGGTPAKLGNHVKHGNSPNSLMNFDGIR